MDLTFFLIKKREAIPNICSWPHERQNQLEVTTDGELQNNQQTARPRTQHDSLMTVRHTTRLATIAHFNE